MVILTYSKPRHLQDPNTGQFIKIIDGRRNQMYLNDAEVNFIELWRQARVLGQKYASEKDKILLKGIRDELFCDHVSFLQCRELPEEVEELLARMTRIKIGIFLSYEEEEKLEHFPISKVSDDTLNIFWEEFQDLNMVRYVKEKIIQDLCI